MTKERSPSSRTANIGGIQSRQPSPTGDQGILVTVAWKRSVERIALNLSAFQAGDKLETVESWKDGTGELTYEVTCEKLHAAQNGDWVITLRYDRELGNNALLADEDPSLQWGNTTLTIGADQTWAEAEFVTDEPEASVITGTCKVQSTSLFQGLSMGVASVLLRPGQATLRKHLLSTHGQCVISNECTDVVLEVAHIIRHADAGAAKATNAILLRADLHKLYDAGVIVIAADGAIDVSNIPNDSKYRKEIPSWNARLCENVLRDVQEALRIREGTPA